MTLLRLPRRISARAIARPPVGRRRSVAVRDAVPEGRAIRLADGRDLGYVEYGDPDGRPVLFFHGFGSSRLVRHPDDSIATSLGLRMIAPDRPGIGLSTPKPGRRMVDWPDDVRQLVDALGIRTFTILAWSGGAPYALACAVAMPDRVQLCGLVSGAAPLAGARGPDYMHAGLWTAVRAADHAPWMVRLAMWKWGRGQRRDPERHLAAAVERMVEADRVIMRDPALRALMVRNATELYRQGRRGLYDEALVLARPWGFDPEDVPVPVLLWHGGHDRTVPPAMGRHMARVLPDCRAVFYPGEGHHLVYDRWREILTTLAA
jgi:pimeloyl-ACP methyl ester carboxylesterase